jgi:hypothetical protein
VVNVATDSRWSITLIMPNVLHSYSIMAPKAKRRRAESPPCISKFKASASHFGGHEERALKIDIVGATNVSEIFPDYSDVETDPDLEHLKLEDYDKDKIVTFSPSKHRELNDNQQRFLMKLKHVLINSAGGVEDSRFEPYVQAMVDVFLQQCKLDDSVQLEVLPSKLRMKIGTEDFATHSDREGVRDERLIWVLQESKHKDDIRYKNGEIQLVSALIAACQKNYSKWQFNLFPQVMYGINVKSDEVTVIKAVFSQEYVMSLFDGLPTQRLTVKRYPNDYGLRLSEPDSRSEVLSLMTKLRKYALSIEVPKLPNRS